MDRTAILSGVALATVFVVSCGSARLDSREDSGGGSSGRPSAHAGTTGEAGAGGTVAGDAGSGDAVAGDAGSGDATVGAAGTNSGGASNDSAGQGGASVTPGSAGSGGSSGEGSIDGSRVVLAFPPPHSYSDAPHVTIRGTAIDPDGVANVSIGGVSAETTDAFATFRLTVPTPVGRNRFPVSVTDTLGNVTAAADIEIVNQGPSLINVKAMAFDPTSHSLFVSDYWSHALVKVDVESGVATTVSGPSRGSGEDFWGTTGLALDLANHRALAQDWGSEVLLGIDLDTGNRKVVSAGGQGIPSIVYASAFTVDADHNRAFAVARPQAEESQVVAIDLTTGDRTLISDVARGTGDTLSAVTDVVYDGGVATGRGPRLLVSELESRAIVAIDIASGDRTLLSSLDRGAGLGFTNPSHLALDAMQGRLLVVDGSRDSGDHTSYRVNRAALVAVDLTTGDRTTLSDPFEGNGYLPETPYAIAFDGTNAYLANDWGGQIAQLHLASKQRKLLVNSDVGTGYKPYYPQALVPFGTSNEAPALLMLEGLNPAIVRVDLTTGTRSLISGEARGSGPKLQSAEELALEPPGQGRSRRAFLVDRYLNAVISVNLETGNRTIVSDSSTGAGLELGEKRAFSPAGVAFDSTKNRLLVTTYDKATYKSSLTAVDLTTGERAIVSDATRGTGPALSIAGLLIDPNPPTSGARAFVLGDASVIIVDLTTGDRSMLSYSYTPTVGLGPPLNFASDIEFNPLNNSFLVAGRSYLAGVRLDNGNRGLLSGRDPLNNGLVGLGPEFDDASGIVFDPARNVAYLANDLRGALLAVDMTTGDRVIIAR